RAVHFHLVAFLDAVAKGGLYLSVDLHLPLLDELVRLAPRGDARPREVFVQPHPFLGNFWYTLRDRRLLRARVASFRWITLLHRMPPLNLGSATFRRSHGLHLPG